MTTRPILLPDSVARAPGRSAPAAPAPRHLPELSKLKRATTEEAGSRNELAWLLVLDNLIDAGEAETRWLDLVGTRLVRGAIRARKANKRHTTGSHNECSGKDATR